MRTRPKGRSDNSDKPISGNARKQANILTTAAAALGSERVVAGKCVARAIALAMLAGNDGGNREAMLKPPAAIGRSGLLRQNDCATGYQSGVSSC